MFCQSFELYANLQNHHFTKNSTKLIIELSALTEHHKICFFLCFSYSATCLKILKMPLAEITDQMVIRHAESLSCLTYLDISCCLNISSKGLEAFGKHCKSLTHLRRNMPPPIESATKIDDMEAIIVANTMSGLNNLELCYGSFGDHGLDAILTKCKALTHIDIQGCWGVTFEGDLEKKCEKLAVFKGPWIDDDF